MPTIATPPHEGLFERRNVGPADPSPAVRLRVTLRRAALTERLAEGADPSSSAELALRAYQLVRFRQRRILARTLQRTIEEVRNPNLRLSAVAPVRRREVLEAERPLRVLIDRLRDDRPVAAEGMALIYCIITDGSWSPLYNAIAPGALRRLTILATAALEPGL